MNTLYIASGDGLGAVLCQKQEDKVRVIAYASRALTKAERNYPAVKLEYLALKWEVTEKYHDYLWGHNFTVFTDNNPLTYVLTTAKLDATGHRWLAALAAYDFDIQYCPGSKIKMLTNSRDYHRWSTVICRLMLLQPSRKQPRLRFPGLVFCVLCSSWICMALRKTHLRASAIGELSRGMTELLELCTDTLHKQRPFIREKILRYAPYFGSVIHPVSHVGANICLSIRMQSQDNTHGDTLGIKCWC